MTNMEKRVKRAVKTALIACLVFLPALNLFADMLMGKPATNGRRVLVVYTPNVGFADSIARGNWGLQNFLTSAAGHAATGYGFVVEMVGVMSNVNAGQTYAGAPQSFTTALPLTADNYCIVFDVRFSNQNNTPFGSMAPGTVQGDTIVQADVTKYANYLATGGSLFVSGDNYYNPALPGAEGFISRMENMHQLINAVASTGVGPNSQCFRIGLDPMGMQPAGANYGMIETDYNALGTVGGVLQYSGYLDSAFVGSGHAFEYEQGQPTHLIGIAWDEPDLISSDADARLVYFADDSALSGWGSGGTAGMTAMMQNVVDFLYTDTCCAAPSTLCAAGPEVQEPADVGIIECFQDSTQPYTQGTWVNTWDYNGSAGGSYRYGSGGTVWSEQTIFQINFAAGTLTYYNQICFALRNDFPTSVTFQVWADSFGTPVTSPTSFTIPANTTSYQCLDLTGALSGYTQLRWRNTTGFGVAGYFYLDAVSLRHACGTMPKVVDPACCVAVTNTFTPTPTNTFTQTRTPTNTNTFTNTFTMTFTPTNTNTFTNTFTYTPTNTPTNTATFTPTNTPTFTFTVTNTRTPTPTNSPTNTPTATNTFTSTFTYTATNTATATNTPTETYTRTFTPTVTWTGTQPPTWTYTNTPTNTNTYTETYTRTYTSTPTNTNTVTNTNSPTNTFTPTNTWTDTPVYTPTFTNTFTDTNTPTNTYTPTNTHTFTFTPTMTNTFTDTNTQTNTYTPTWTFTFTHTPTMTPTSPPFPFVIRIGIYNPAGELVRTLLVSPVTDYVTAVDLSVDGSAGKIVTTGGTMSISLPGVETPGTYGMGGTVVLWDGSGDTGQDVSPGAYYLKIEQTDAYNHTNVTIENIFVVALEEYVLVTIYNAAGEIVRLMRQESAPASDTLRLSMSDSVATGKTTVISYGTDPGDNVSWDGKNDMGLIVGSGTYEVKVKVKKADGRAVEASKTFVVLTQEQDYLTGVKAYPNPYSRELTTAPMIFAWDATTVQGDIKVKIYNIKGEKAREITARLSDGSIEWDGKGRGGARVSSGVYVAFFEAVSSEGYVNRIKIKIAVLF